MTKKDRVRHLLRDLNYTHAAIAKIADVDEATIRRWRKAESVVGLRATPSEVDETFGVAVEALVDGVLRTRDYAPSGSDNPPPPSGETQQLIVVADAHLSKLCWPPGTGDAAYDLSIAKRLILGGVKYLAAREGMVTDRVLAFLGDFFHYDTLGGTTTSGTALDRDSRLPKMLDVGAELATQCIRHCATLGSVKVIIVPGNHDTVLTSALQRILVSEFRDDPRITVDSGHTARKYHTFGKNAFMFTHGDRRKKELPTTFAVEQPRIWGNATHREIHTGHLHTEIEQHFGTLTHNGCVLHTHRSMSPPDQWHADEQYVGSGRGMQSFTYHTSGGEIASHTVSPSLLTK